MPRKPVKKVSFQMPAKQALEARWFIKRALKNEPTKMGSAAAQKLVEQLDVALRMELGWPVEDDDMRDHYDFSKGVRGKPTRILENPYMITINYPTGALTITVDGENSKLHFKRQKPDSKKASS